jgi:hypothetical protein
MIDPPYGFRQDLSALDLSAFGAITGFTGSLISQIEDLSIILMSFPKNPSSEITPTFSRKSSDD